jgi:hypothetical protein
MLDVLADRLSYPSNFTSWDKEVAIDEEDFARCLAYTLGFRNRYRLCLRQQPLSSSDFYPPLNLIVGVGRFRENDLARDMLESCYMAMRVHFFLHLGQRMDAAPDVWQVHRYPYLYLYLYLYLYKRPLLHPIPLLSYCGSSQNQSAQAHVALVDREYGYLLKTRRSTG